jgi:type II secretory pathway pseudopilin PulG
MFKLSGKQKGLSLIEALLVLGLLATIITVITQNFQKASEKQKVQTMNQEIFQIYAGIQQNFSDDGTSELATTGNLTAGQLGIKPATVKGDISLWKHGFEGLYTIEKNTNDDYGFNLIVDKVPAGYACTEIIRASKKASWTHIGLSKTATATEGDEVVDWSVGQIATECSPGANSDVSIMFTYNPS